MKKLILLIISITSFTLDAQSVTDYFVASANHYVQSENQAALDEVNAGLEKYPDNKKLTELKKMIENQKDNDQKQQSENNQGQSPDKNSQQQAEETDSQQESGQQDGRNKGQEGTGSSDQTPLNEEGKEPTSSRGDQGERLKKHRYDNILKALENQEQDTQRRLILGESKSRLGRKQKDW